jgi:endonuclease YncB( thermonuclease family)
MIQDKSTRFTLIATGILLVALFLIGWLLTRSATARREAAEAPLVTVVPAPAVSSAPVPAAVPPPEAAPTLPLNTTGQPIADYQVLTGVTLVADPANDGDTFLLKTPEGTHRFCLYFADAVETDGAQLEATRELAAYFNFDSEEPLRELGVEAKEFSLRLLGGGDSRVVTRWEKSPGEGAFLAFIYLKDSEQGLINLAQWLVRYGLARIVQADRAQPDGTSAADFLKMLQEEEVRSKAEAHGAWSRKAR